MEGAKFHSIETGEPIRPAPIEQLAVDQKINDVHKAIDQHIKCYERIVAELFLLEGVSCDRKGGFAESGGAGQKKQTLQNKEADLNSQVIRLFFLFCPLQLCQGLQDYSHHTHQCKNNQNIMKLSNSDGG